MRTNFYPFNIILKKKYMLEFEEDLTRNIDVMCDKTNRVVSRLQ